MNWILDLSILLFVALCVFMGIRRGLIGSLAKMLGGVLRLVVSILLAKPFVKLVSLTNIDEHLFDKLHLKFSGLSDKFNVNLVGMDAETLGTFTGDALADADIPKLFRGFFSNIFNISPEVIATKESVTIAELMSVTVANIILLAISFVVVFILLWIVSKLVIRWSKRHAVGNTLFAKTNRWLGAIFGFVKSLLILFVGFIVVACFSGFGFMEGVVEYINATWIAKLLYNGSNALINSSFDLKSMLEGWLN